ncbi:MAG: DNA metabolism protein [Provencibacterium sp.]|jgi:probable DNA metabolism protein|nr:DNA metabolism protein [Provencibacterium sp.]
MSERRDLVYLYDGSFAGLLCCVFESFYQHERPEAIYTAESYPCTLYPVREIKTDPSHSERVWHAIERKLGELAADLTQFGFLTCHAQKEELLLDFLKLGFRVGPQVVHMLQNETVHTLTHAVRALRNEAHLLCGFLRFSEINGILAAVIGPKNSVLPVLREHFCDRFANETFMIFDRTHKLALFYQGGYARIVPVESLSLPAPGKKEKSWEALWKRFHETIAIEGRLNPRCQMGHCPKRYWGYMTEFGAAEAASFFEQPQPELIPADITENAYRSPRSSRLPQSAGRR